MRSQVMGGAAFRRFFAGSAVLLLLTVLAASVALYAPGSNGRWQALAISFGGGCLSLAIAAAYAASVNARVARIRQIAQNLANELGRDLMPEGEDLSGLEHCVVRVSERTKALVETTRMEAERREAILSSMVEGVLAVDDRLRVTFCNGAFARLAGRMPCEGTPLLELVRDASLSTIFTEVIESGTSVKRQLYIPAAGERSFEVQASPLASDGKPGAIAIFHDITDLERVEKVRKDFVANVSHEFRTPLAAIVGYAETLLDGALEDGENNRRFLEIIRSNAIRLNSIASDLLTLSDLQSGPGQNAERVSVVEALDSAVTTVASEAGLRGVRILRDRVDDVHIRGSRVRLEQALVNLLANAVKFNREGGEVRLAAMANGSGEAHITVADTGVGIPSSDLPRIFERFYRVDKARSRQVGGTGLGLSIVKHIVDRMNGRIAVDSQLGRGSSFTISIPLY